MKQSPKAATLIGIAAGILFIVVFTNIGLALLTTNTLLYRVDMAALDIPAYSGFPADLVLRNFKALLRYVSPFYNGPFELPDLPASESGIQHFEETKVIFNGVYLAGLIALVLLVVLFIALRKRNKSRVLLAASVTSLAIPLAVLLGIAVDFDGFFTLFHKVFFNNDYWIFDYHTDPVIRILPSEFFMHCAIVIAACWVVGSVVLFLLSRRQKKKARLQAEAT